MTNELGEHISKMIVQTFPCETAERYYIPSIKKKDSVHKKSEISKGKLMSMWRNRTYKNKQLLKRINNEIVNTTVNKINQTGKQNYNYIHIHNFYNLFF